MLISACVVLYDDVRTVEFLFIEMSDRVEILCVIRCGYDQSL